MWWLVVAGVCSYSREYLQAFGLLNGTAGGATEFHGLFDWTVIDPLTNGTIAPPSPCQNPCVDPTDEVGVLHFPGMPMVGRVSEFSPVGTTRHYASRCHVTRRSGLTWM